MKTLKQLRLGKGLSLRELAKELGIDYSTLCRYERNQRTATFQAANKIATYFERPIEEIFPEYQRTAPYPEKIAKT